MSLPTQDHGLACRLLEALVFASAEPVTERAIAELLVAQGVLDERHQVGAIIEQVRAASEGRGVTLVQVAGGWQFRTAADLAPRLTRVIERPRRLPRSAMETLSIVAYHQPCTRAEIETIRGVSLSQQTLDLLLEASLIVPKGRKEVPGRPTLWGTSQEFLERFGLAALGDLPRREELLAELPVIPVDEPSPPDQHTPDHQADS
ncbi:SMC-Scp complex subunit ScpB [Lichenicola sp.]|uniref:SMC-Scp complex subunit ScpB n=1 Tax=Lichenicola sp. TaxID=2804529 RepID=UPI003B00F66E